MENISKLGNIEFLNCFLAWHYKKFGFFKLKHNNDPRIDIYIKENDEFLEELLFQLDESTVNSILCEEAKKRGLSENFSIEPFKEMWELVGLVFSDEVCSWQESMLKNPTYIKEIRPIANFGDEYVDDSENGLSSFDSPVREACGILYNKGYKTYWSSANRKDACDRISHVAKDKNVGYILIDPVNLSEEQKAILLLDGNCSFWGLALNHSDNGKYYGIWAEIASEEMKCEELSEILSAKALELPSLINVQHR